MEPIDESIISRKKKPFPWGAVKVSWVISAVNYILCLVVSGEFIYLPILISIVNVIYIVTVAIDYNKTPERE